MEDSANVQTTALGRRIAALSPAKRALLERKLQSKQVVLAGAIPKEVERTSGPLSFAQQRLWFLDRMEAGTAYNMPWAFELSGALDVDALERSLLEIVRRHEALRTRFPEVNGKPVQRVVPADELALRVFVDGEEVEGNPGYYTSKFFLRPHYQLEGVNVTLSLTSKLPSAKAA